MESLPGGNPRSPPDRGECPARTSTPWQARRPSYSRFVVAAARAYAPHAQAHNTHGQIDGVRRELG